MTGRGDPDALHTAGTRASAHAISIIAHFQGDILKIACESRHALGEAERTAAAAM